MLRRAPHSSISAHEETDRKLMIHKYRIWLQFQLNVCFCDDWVIELMLNKFHISERLSWSVTMSSLKLQKRLAADVMKCGKKKVIIILFILISGHFSASFEMMIHFLYPEILWGYSSSTGLTSKRRNSYNIHLHLHQTISGKFIKFPYKLRRKLLVSW